MPSRSILDQSSLAATLWNLEEARLSGAPPDDPHAHRALAWVLSRHQKPGSYRDILFAPTSLDLSLRRATPTGEDSQAGDAAVVHILGEESLRALVLWDHTDEIDVASVGEQVLNWAEPQAPGHYCCYRCSVARWRTLVALRPPGWERALRDGIKQLLTSPHSSTGHWEHYPFYYSLLALSETPLEEVDTLRMQARPAAENMLKRLEGNGQSVRFKRRALEWAVER